MAFCKQCGNELLENQDVCLNCGFKKGKGNSYCPTCGASVLAEQDVCVNCGKKLTDFIDEYGDTTKLVIDVCINEDITLQLKGIGLVNAIDSTMGYATINTSSARVVRINNTHNDINFKVPEEFVLPEYKPGYNYENYYENFLLGNSSSNVERFYKMNKPSTNPTININKYLIW